MTLDKGATDKLSEFANEARRLGIKIEPPSVNRSGVDFEVAASADGNLSILYALSAIKGVGEGQSAALVAARGGRPFADLGDFAERISARDVNKRMLECLAAAGAFDALEADRARVAAAIEPILALAHRREDERSAGQSGLFDAERVNPLAGIKVDSWSLAERLQHEFEFVGFFLSGHPLDAYGAVLQRLRVRRWSDFARAVKQGAFR